MCHGRARFSAVEVLGVLNRSVQFYGDRILTDER
jgi:hypothetical protein